MVPKNLSYSRYVSLFSHNDPLNSSLRKPTSDLDVELVYLGLSRFRCLADSPGKPSDPLLVISATAFKNTFEECEKALAPFLDCPRIEEALVNAQNVPTSIKEEYEVQERDNPDNCR